VALCTGVVMLAVAAWFVAVALGAVSTTVHSASNMKLGEQVVVNAQGRTLYTLSGETTGHLKCKSRECFAFWPPLTVPSRRTKLKAGPGVEGHLGILRRSNGKLQVTLRGLPLYRFASDHASGEANGEAIESFGGTWHALPAAANAGPVAAPPPASPPAPPPGYGSPAPGYGY
jgi:predicted lipoprotein with Yx(FWY)xxD motif